MGRGKRAKGKGAIIGAGVCNRLGIDFIDQMLVAFENEEVYLSECDEMQRVSEWRSCTFKNAACHAVSEVFVEFLSEHNIEAALSDEVEGPEFADCPSILGYTDRPVKGSPWHTVALVYCESDIYAVDWSAHQYGYSVFPLVQKWSPNGWLRKWPRSPVPIPKEVRTAAYEMLASLSGPLSLGDTRVVDGFCLEIHTIGCRNHADDPEDEWWERHWRIYDEYAADSSCTILGDPADGYFATITRARSAA